VVVGTLLLLFYVKNASTSNGRVLHNNFGYSDGRRRYRPLTAKVSNDELCGLQYGRFAWPVLSAAHDVSVRSGDYISKDHV
jgi:hypothetical protein